MKTKLKSIYDSLKSNMHEISSISSDSNCIINWIPILTFGTQKRLMGITRNGEWGIEIASGFCVIDKSNSYLYCLQLLETDFDEFDSLLLNALPECINIYDIFPFKEIIAFGFENGQSDYWLELAFKWYDCIDQESKCLLERSLLVVEKNTKVSQKIRHLARARLNKLNLKY